MASTNTPPADSLTTESSPASTSWTEWRHERIDEPSAAEQRRLRDRTLELGNATSFDLEDVPKDKKRRFRRLDKHHRDNYSYREDVDISASCDRQYKISTMKDFGGQLSMSDLQIERAIEWVLTTDLPRVGLPMELVGFCICVLVVRQEAEERYDDDALSPSVRRDKDPLYSPYRSDDANPEPFVTLANRLIEVHGRITTKQIQSMMNKLRSGLPEREWALLPSEMSESMVTQRPSYTGGACTDQTVGDAGSYPSPEEE